MFREQINAGFVLGDPADRQAGMDKNIFDPDTGVTFSVQWNPDRDIRGNHRELVKRGIIAEDVDASRLINTNEEGVACYLCRENIKIQNPKEVLMKVSLAGRDYLAGANIAPITDNHFTMMSTIHHPQPSGEAMVSLLSAAADLTNGAYIAVYNGLAGASIEHHEHFHITTSRFPIEQITTRQADIIRESKNIKVSRLKYYLPLWIIEGGDSAEVGRAACGIISAWHTKDIRHHTENIIFLKNGYQYRMFIILRDRRKLKGVGKTGAIAAFECGGIIVLSGKDRELYENIDLARIKAMLESISP